MGSMVAPGVIDPNTFHLTGHEFDSESFVLVLNAPDGLSEEDVRAMHRSMVGLVDDFKKQGWKRVEYIISRQPLTVQVMRFVPEATSPDEDVDDVLQRVDPLELI